MKRVLTVIAVLMLAGITGCKKTMTPDLPGPDKEQQEQEVTVPAKEYPVDVQKAFQETGLVNKETAFTTYSPHSGISVSEISYSDYAGSPQAVFVMQVDLSDKTVSMTNTVPGATTGDFSGGREKLSAQFKRIDTQGHRVEGGVNTDFFITSGSNAGSPQGIFWQNGTCYKDVFDSEATRPRSFVYWSDNEKVRMARSADYPNIKSFGLIKEAFSGGVLLVEKGGPSPLSEDSVSGVHPRTMLGIMEDNTKVVLVVLDGRDKTRAVGMNYLDMQKIMLSLGCQYALNIDGGGSSTFIVREAGDTKYGADASFEIRNKPSDGTERAIGPGLAIISSE